MISLADLFILYGLILLVTVGYIVGAIVFAYLICYIGCFLIEKMRNLRYGNKNSV